MEDKDKDKTKEQLVSELEEMRHRVAEAEKSEPGQMQLKEISTPSTDDIQSLLNGLYSASIGLDIVGLDYRVYFQNQLLEQRFGNIIGKMCYEEYMGLKQPCGFCPMVLAVKGRRYSRLYTYPARP